MTEITAEAFHRIARESDLERLRQLTKNHTADSRLLGNMRADTMWNAIEFAQSELTACKAKLARVEALLSARGDSMGGARYYITVAEIRAALEDK